MNTPQDFCYWLQGFVELQDAETISEKQWLAIKDHLKLVFDKVTPDRTQKYEINIPPTSIPQTDWKKMVELFDNTRPFQTTTITC